MEKINELIAWLQSDGVKGTWPTISKETGLGIWWIQKFAQGGIKDPSYTRITKLSDYKSALEQGA